MRSSASKVLALVCSLTVLNACGRDNPRSSQTAPKKVQIGITPTNLDLLQGQAQSIDVVLYTDTGTVSLIGDPGLELSSSENDVATITASTALVLGQGTGTATLTASYKSATANSFVRVSGQKVIGITAEPVFAALEVGDSFEISVKALIDDGSTIDVTQDAATQYVALDNAVIEVTNEGVVTGQSSGETNVEITYSTFSAQVAVLVSNEGVEFESIRLEPEELSLQYGASQQIQAYGLQADGTEINLVDAGLSVEFQSSDEDIATIGPDGTVLASNSLAGQSTLIAQYADLSAFSIVSVTPPEASLIGISVRPSILQLGVGGSEQLTVLGIYSDGNTADLTLGLTGTVYLSEDPSLVSVDENGLVRGVAVGDQVTVTITHANFEASVGVTVAQDVRLLSLTAAPNAIQIEEGDFSQLTVIANYSDGTQVDVTNAAQYFPRPTGIVNVSSSGLVLGVAAGETLITVEFDGQQTTVTARVESAAPTIVALTIQPALITAGTDPANVSVPFTIEALYSDGSRVDVTRSVGLSLSIANPAIAQIVSGNQIQGLTLGDTELVASFDGLEARAPISITEAPNNIVFIFITAPSTLTIGQQEQFSVLAVLDDGSFQDITTSAQLSVTPSNVVNVQGGFVTGLSAGQAEITATYQGFVSAEVEITVTAMPDPLIGIEIVPDTLSLQVGQSEIVNVFALFQSGNRAVITFDPTLNTSWSGPIDVLPDILGGRVLATGPGRAQIDVSYMGFSAQANITIANTPPTVVAIVINVESMVEVGQSIPFSVEGRLSDGTFIDLTVDPMISTNSNPSGLVEINGSLLRGLAAGMTTVTASYGSVSAQTTVTVLDSPITEIFWVPNTLTLDINETVSAAVRARRANGQEFEVSTDPNLSLIVTGGVVATQTANGIEVTGQSAGRASVQARFQGFQGNLGVVVNAPTLTQIRGEPNPIQLDIGDRQVITVFGTYSDGSEQTLTGASFNSLSSAIATVDANGIVEAVSSGSTVIFIDFNGTGTLVTVEVAAPRLIGISASPDPLNIQVGANGQITVAGNFSDGSSQPISGAVFSSDNTNIATVSNTGVVNGVAAGNVKVDVDFGGFSAFVEVLVSSAPVTLIGISLNPPMITLEVGNTQQYSVTASFSDGTSQTVTGASFSVSVPAVASISSGGLLTGLSAGLSRVIADYQGETAFGLVEVELPTVTLVGIRLEPAVVTLAPAATQQMTVVGIFSDGSEVNQAGAVFSSSDSSVAAVSGQGLVTAGSAAGTAIITAQFSGFVANSVVIVTGTQVTLIGIRIEPASLSLNIGQSSRLTVVGSYSDGTEQTLNGSSFVSTNAMIASVNSSGDVTGVSPGNSQVVATISGFSATIDVSVSVPGPVLFSIRFDPSSFVLQPGGTTNVTLIGTYSDGSQSAVTPDQLTSGDTSIATITAMGQLEAIAEGNTTINAVKGALTAQANVTVLTAQAPTITNINPNAIAVGTSFAMVTITGTGFLNSSRVILNGQAIPSVFQSSTSINALIPASFVQSTGILDLLIRNAATQGGDSNVVEILVGEPPTITSYAPNAALANSSAIVTVRGTNLLSISASSSLINVVNIVEDGSGTQVELTIVVPNIMTGVQSITISNPFGSATINIDVLPNSGNPDLEVGNGETVTLSGVNVYNNILIQTGGAIIGTGRDPLVLYSTGDITVRGNISVNGSNGEDGFSDPAAGGEGGPGAGGGGGAGDGDANPPAAGGAGSPAGQGAGNPIGAGTRAGNGGGDGGGTGGNGGCGQGGGGGALVGAGGGAGGDQGVGTGGAGGVPGSGSSFGAGTGGGGGSTCGPNSGGGGGGGGGILILEVAQGGTLIVDGTLSAKGGNAGNAFFGTGGGGGGSGGRIEIIAPSGNIVINDTISVRGGDGGQADFGDGGGGGGGGTVIVNALPLGNITANLGLFDLVGGAPGPSLGNGFPGEAGDQGSVTITP